MGRKPIGLSNGHPVSVPAPIPDPFLAVGDYEFFSVNADLAWQFGERHNINAFDIIAINLRLPDLSGEQPVVWVVTGKIDRN